MAVQSIDGAGPVVNFSTVQWEAGRRRRRRRPVQWLCSGPDSSSLKACWSISSEHFSPSAQDLSAPNLLKRAHPADRPLRQTHHVEKKTTMQGLILDTRPSLQAGPRLRSDGRRDVTDSQNPSVRLEPLTLRPPQGGWNPFRRNWISCDL